MDEVSALQHDSAGEQPLTALWERVSGRFGDFGREEEPARRQILQRSFSAQLEGVVRAFYQIAQGDLATRDIARPAIRRVLTEILVHFPVYRIYAGVAHASPPDLQFLSQAVARAKITCLPSDRWLVEILGRWLVGARIRSGADAQQTIALARFQQLSASLCAKAVEDTAFYRYGRLLSRNDVGFDPRRFSCASAEFHRRIQERAADFPHSMLATATHDHKRGEDVRARLAVLSETGRRMDAGRRAMDRALRCALRRGRHHADAERGRYRHSAANSRRRLAAGTGADKPRPIGGLRQAHCCMAAESTARSQAVQRLVGAERDVTSAPLANSSLGFWPDHPNC